MNPALEVSSTPTDDDKQNGFTTKYEGKTAVIHKIAVLSLTIIPFIVFVGAVIYYWGEGISLTSLFTADCFLFHYHHWHWRWLPSPVYPQRIPGKALAKGYPRISRRICHSGPGYPLGLRITAGTTHLATVLGTHIHLTYTKAKPGLTC